MKGQVIELRRLGDELMLMTRLMICWYCSFFFEMKLGLFYYYRGVNVRVVFIFTSLVYIVLMAFKQHGTQVYECAEFDRCRTKLPYFQMIKSNRDIHLEKDGSGSRICPTCELGFRQVEFNERWTEERRQQYPQYCTMIAIEQARKLERKSRHWTQFGEVVESAKKEVDTINKQESGGYKISRKRRCQAVIDRAVEKAMYLANCVASSIIGPFVGGIADRFRKTAAIVTRLKDVEAKLTTFPQVQKWHDEYKKLEAEYHENQKYTTAAGKGTEQYKWLQAIDYMDELGPDMKCYNVCRAKTGEWNTTLNQYSTCGFCAPAKFWLKVPNKWKLYCCCDLGKN